MRVDNKINRFAGYIPALQTLFLHCQMHFCRVQWHIRKMEPQNLLHHLFLKILHISLLHKPINNLLFCLMFRKSECHKLDKLLSSYLADCSLMDKTCIKVICLKLRHGIDMSVIHKNCITFSMSVTLVVTAYF